MANKRIPYQDNFLNIYLDDYDQVTDHFEYNPQQSESVKARLEYLKSHDRDRLRQVGSILLRANMDLGCGEKTEENIQLLAAGSAVAVVTGQQTGILTGPLYTIYKIVTAIALAEKMAEEYEASAVPIFWAASEDHDFQEISTVSVFDQSHSLQEFVVSSPKPGRISIGFLPLEQPAQECIDFLRDMTPAGPYKDEMMGIVQRSFDHSSSMAEWCSRLISSLFNRYGLIIINAMDPDLRKLSSEIFTLAINQTEQIYEQILHLTDLLSEKGMKAQLETDPEILPFFHNSKEGRFQIMKTAEGLLHIGGTVNETLTREELIEQVETSPELFSPNVILRPIIQDHLLPTAFYVAGPGELAYYAQLKGVYPLFAKKMPIIYPRFSASLILPTHQETVAELGLEIDALISNPDQELELLLQRKEIFPIDERFLELTADFESAYESLTLDLQRIDEDLTDIAAGNLGRILSQVEYLRKKSKQKHRKNEKDTVARFDKVKDFLLPDKQLQERVLNVFPFLFMYGEGLIEKLFAALPWKSDAHTLVDLGDDENR